MSPLFLPAEHSEWTAASAHGTEEMNKRNVAVIAGLAAGLLLVGGGAFAGGQATRLSDGEVAQRVNAAVAKQARQDRKAQAQAVKMARFKTANLWEDKLEKAIRKARRVAHQNGYEDGRSDGYSAGNADGYESGHDAGRQDGLIEGSDDLTCSDDPDVTWLPSCSYYY
jgi:hypothetical protein